MRAIYRIVSKEFLAHILTFKFALMLLICPSLIYMSIYMGAMKYKGRLKDYYANQERIMRWIEDSVRTGSWAVESNVLANWWVLRKPHLLSSLVEGCEVDLGDFIRVNHKHVPYKAFREAEMLGGYRIGSQRGIFTKDFQSFDLALMLQIIIGLFAVLFVHDSISGEKEAGTLKLLASQGISRGAILIGKYLGAMAVLLIPLSIAFLEGSLFLYFEFGEGIGLDEILRISLLYAVSILYLSIFVLIGILSSGMTARSSTSLILGLSIWIFVAIIWPNVVGFAVKELYNRLVPPDKPVTDKINLIREEYNNEIRSRVNPSPHPEQIPLSLTWNPEEVMCIFYHDLLPPERIPEILPQVQERARLAEMIGMRHSERIWNVRKDFLERYPYRYIRLAWFLARAFPSGAYYELMSILSETDWGSYLRSLDRAREYRKTLQEWATNSIRTMRWFTNMFGYPDISKVPRFEGKDESIGEGLLRARWDILLILLMNILCFIEAYIKIASYDVR